MEEKVEGEGLDIERVGAGLEAGEDEEIVEEQLKAAGMLAHDAQVAGGFLGGEILRFHEGLEIAVKDGERGAQLVGDVGDELAADLLELFDAGDIVEHGDNAGDRAGLVAHGDGIDAQETLGDGGAWMGNCDLVDLDGLALGGVADKVAEGRLAGGTDDGLANGLGLEREHLAKGVVHGTDHLVGIDDDNAFHHAGKDGVEIESLLLNIALEGLMLAPDSGELLGDLSKIAGAGEGVGVGLAAIDDGAGHFLDAPKAGEKILAQEDHRPQAGDDGAEQKP